MRCFTRWLASVVSSSNSNCLMLAHLEGSVILLTQLFCWFTNVHLQTLTPYKQSVSQISCTQKTKCKDDVHYCDIGCACHIYNHPVKHSRKSQINIEISRSFENANVISFFVFRLSHVKLIPILPLPILHFFFFFFFNMFIFLGWSLYYLV